MAHVFLRLTSFISTVASGAVRVVSLLLWLSSTPIRAHCMYTPHVVHPLISQCTLRFTLYLGYCKCAAMNNGVRLSFRISVFIFFS